MYIYFFLLCHRLAHATAHSDEFISRPPILACKNRSLWDSLICLDRQKRLHTSFLACVVVVQKSFFRSLSLSRSPVHYDGVASRGAADSGEFSCGVWFTVSFTAVAIIIDEFIGDFVIVLPGYGRIGAGVRKRVRETYNFSGNQVSVYPNRR